jgi:hypothetical protein
MDDKIEVTGELESMSLDEWSQDEDNRSLIRPMTSESIRPYQLVLRSGTAAAILGAAIYCLLADRTFFFEKEVLHSGPNGLSISMLIIAVVSLITLRRSHTPKDAALGDNTTSLNIFLQRATLSEWEGFITLSLSALSWNGTLRVGSRLQHLSLASTTWLPQVQQLVELYTPWWSVPSSDILTSYPSSILGIAVGILQHAYGSKKTQSRSRLFQLSLRIVVVVNLAATMALTLIYAPFKALPIALVLSSPAYLTLRSLSPSHHSVLLTYCGRYARELYVLRQHAFLASNGLARARLGLLTGTTTMHYSQMAGPARALDGIVLGCIALAMSSWIGDAVAQVEKLIDIQHRDTHVEHGPIEV